jgi:hypothetical protein
MGTRRAPMPDVGLTASRFPAAVDTAIRDPKARALLYFRNPVPEALWLTI